MKSLATIVASLAMVAGLLAPALAQKPMGSPSPGPEDERMTRMMQMMGDMEQQMGQMQEQMKGMQGMGGMQGRMGQMKGSMQQMHQMMQQHRAELQRGCPGAMAPATPPAAPTK